MEVLTEIVRNVTALLLLAALLELLLPEGSTARFIRVAIGLMLTASILIPLLTSLDFSTLEADFAEEEFAAAAYVEQGTELAEQLNRSAETQY